MRPIIVMVRDDEGYQREVEVISVPEITYGCDGCFFNDGEDKCGAKYPVVDINCGAEHLIWIRPEDKPKYIGWRIAGEVDDD